MLMDGRTNSLKMLHEMQVKELAIEVLNLLIREHSFYLLEVVSSSPRKFWLQCNILSLVSQIPQALAIALLTSPVKNKRVP